MKQKITILYHDDMLAVAVKPAGVLSQPDRTGEDSMTEFLKEQLGTDVFSVHRLDRAVGGVMVFAMTRAVAGKLSALIGSDSFEKEYLTIIHGIPEQKQGDFTDFLYHDTKRNMTSVVSSHEKDAKEARLSYALLEQNEDSSLVKVRLHTGRTHQIRVQFASRNMPIIGDGKYGARDRMNLALFSHRLSFKHPIKKKRMTFTAFPHSQMQPWDRFETFLTQNAERISK